MKHLIALLAAAALVSAPATAYAEQFREVNDVPAPIALGFCKSQFQRFAEIALKKAEERANESGEGGSEPICAEVCADYAPTYQNGAGLTREGGVNRHDGRTETWYSSNVLYHYRTPEWTVDAEGFYRTQEGYYVVAASDKPQGSTFEGSKGMCIVLDSGCAAGTTDYYTNF